MGGELGNETFTDVLVVFSIVMSTKFHLDPFFLFLYGLCFFRLEKLVLLSFRGYLGELESEITKA